MVVDSAAERKSRVEMPLELGSMGTLEKWVLRTSNQVLPEGMVDWDMVGGAEGVRELRVSKERGLRVLVVVVGSEGGGRGAVNETMKTCQAHKWSEAEQINWWRLGDVIV